MSRFYKALEQTNQQQPLPARSPQSGVSPVLVTPRDEMVHSTRSSSSKLEDLALRLVASQRDTRPQIIVTAGATNDDHGCLVATSLASALSAQSDRVLLVEANVREGALLHHSGTPGVNEVLSNGSDYLLAVRKTPQYSVLLAGGPNRNPTALFEGPRAPSFFSQLRERWDFVVIGTSAVRTRPDATLIARNADAAILAIQAGSTKKEELLSARTIISRAEVPVLGVVICNSSDQNGSSQKTSYLPW